MTVRSYDFATGALLWEAGGLGENTIPQPVQHETRLYVLSDSGQLSAFDASTGKPLYQQARLPRPYNFKASPVGAAGRLYLATEDEDVVVVRMGDAFEVLATNTLTEQSFIASPIALGNNLYLRSRTHLFAIGK